MKIYSPSIFWWHVAFFVVVWINFNFYGIHSSLVHILTLPWILYLCHFHSQSHFISYMLYASFTNLHSIQRLIFKRQVLFGSIRIGFKKFNNKVLKVQRKQIGQIGIVTINSKNVQSYWATSRSKCIIMVFLLENIDDGKT